MTTPKAPLLSRILDLYVLGTELFLGLDDDGNDVVVWLHKPNSFAKEDADEDGQTGRTRYLKSMDTDSDEHQNLLSDLAAMDKDALITALMNVNYEEDQLMATHDVASDPDWVEQVAYLDREPALMNDADLAEDHPRRTQWLKVNSEYVDAVKAAFDVRQVDRKRALGDQHRSEMEETMVDVIKNRRAVDYFIRERNVTRLWRSMRVCTALRVKGETPLQDTWDHASCDHSIPLLTKRSEVYGLPDEVNIKALDTLNAFIVNSAAASK